MSNAFASYPAKPAFGHADKTLFASEHIQRKKNKHTFCKRLLCHPAKNVYSQSNLLMMKRSRGACNIPFETNELYSNLYTKVELDNDVLVVADLSGNTYPTPISTTAIPFLTYNIDASGNLFGNTVCGLTNYEQYIVYNPPSTMFTYR